MDPRGDIQPFIALGRRLQGHGHHVKIAALKQFEEYIKTEGMNYAPLAFPYRMLHENPVPTLYAYSSIVAPKPSDWDNNRYLTGYWWCDDKTVWKPNQSLIKFLASGSKPIYIGFGSMVGGSFNGKGGILPSSIGGRWIALIILGSIPKIIRC